MWQSPVTVVAAEAEPVTVEQAKIYCRVDDDDLDDQIAGYIAAARARVESITGTRLVSQIVQLKASGFADLEALPIGPVLTIVELTYHDRDGIDVEIDPDLVELAGPDLGAGIRPVEGGWPADAGAVSLTVAVGYGAPPAVPRELWLAQLKLIQGMLDGEDRDIMPLLVNHRIWL